MSATAALTYTHRLISINSPAEWKQALEGVPHPFAHTWESCHAMQLSTGHRTFLYSFEAENARILCPIAERDYGTSVDVVTPYGFSGFAGTADCPQFPRAWREFCEQRHYVCAYFTVHPQFQRADYYAPQTLSLRRSVYILDLKEKSEAQLFAQCSKTRRQSLRKWEASGVVIVEDHARLADFFIANYREFFSRKSAAEACSLCPETFRALFAEENVLVLGAEVQGQLESVAVFGYTPHAAEYLFSICLPGCSHHGAGLIWTAVTRFLQNGVPILNLGGGAQPDDSICEFKRRFGATEVPFNAAQEIFSPELYDTLCLRAAVGSRSASYFPAYRAEARR